MRSQKAGFISKAVSVYVRLIEYPCPGLAPLFSGWNLGSGGNRINLMVTVSALPFQLASSSSDWVSRVVAISLSPAVLEWR